MFINPLLECNATYNYYNPWKIKDTIDTYIRENIESWNIIDAAYYVRLLKNGSNFWYNEDIKFIPASLVKLPLAISLMRQLSFDELSTIILVSEVPTDTYSWDLVPDKVQVWKRYSLYALLSEMLINSDNTAATALLWYLNTEKVLQTYEHFGLGIIDFNINKSLNMSVEDYATFFRILYNSSYLGHQDSEELLSLLSKSSFTSGIRAFLPQNLTIANKFWIRTLPNWEIHLHDCWNIYFQESPYLLCVMTRGNDKEKQSRVIQEISKMVYDDISQK